MKAILVALFVAFCVAEVDYLDEFQKWMNEHNKHYRSDEFEHKFENFKDSYDYVQNFDTSAHTYTVGLNAFSDLSTEEFRAQYVGLNYIHKGPYKYVPGSKSGLPTQIDWRKKGAVTPVKDQGHCGACYSFSATGALEGAHQIATGKLVGLSEQQLIDCSRGEGNSGCGGGLMDWAFRYVIKAKGIESEADYPYTAKNNDKCTYDASKKAADITAYHDIPSGNEQALQEALLINPVSVAIDASHPSFGKYKSGVYYERFCYTHNLDHGVLVAGYGVLNGTDYYLVKNSWGPTWGDHGYILMSRNRHNNCGIATMASYPTGAS